MKIINIIGIWLIIFIALIYIYWEDIKLRWKNRNVLRK